MAHTVVGLDIGTSGVRAAEFRLAARRKPHLRKFATCPLPEGAVSRGAVVDGAAVTDALRSLWSRGKFSTKAVVIGIANEGVLVRQMDLDWMPPADFRQALRYQVAEALPVPVDEANLDYHLLEEIEVAGEVEGQTKRMNRILLVAAAREVVDGYVTAAQSAGLRVTRADLLPFALIRVASPRSSLNAPAEAIIDIGAETTSLVVHQGGRPGFVRMIPATGSNTITKTLQDTYDWSWEEAERSKIALGMGGLSPGDPSVPAVAPHPAQQVIADQARKLVTEVGATLDFFLGSTGGSTELSRVLLCGAGARLGGLAELFAEELGLPVEMLQPMRAIRASRGLAMDDDRCGQLSVSAGLCLGVSA